MLLFNTIEIESCYVITYISFFYSLNLPSSPFLITIPAILLTLPRTFYFSPYLLKSFAREVCILQAYTLVFFKSRFLYIYVCFFFLFLFSNHLTPTILFFFALFANKIYRTKGFFLDLGVVVALFTRIRSRKVFISRCKPWLRL